ncbi:unnamed protein product [Acanthoscelides obtectus]|uniref:Uncharacterized protein n=1 Tax=Acanthoscelides obtectus TaxID=200917 RepID=A0A9P0PAB3_ACAOB|nr:unnamed protein product [Acanthoscelides obtectus]CAK1682052.1 hypothetical protein AOBTE_LOCUS33401 [Acanthoscelides obtectus]
MNADMETDSKENDKEAYYSLKDCFHDIIKGKSLELDLKTLEYFLRNNLEVYYYDGMNPMLRSILPYMLVVFMKSWPGWQKLSRLIKREISFDDWFSKFERYLIYKINYTVKTEFDKAMLLIKNLQPIDDSILFKIDNATQTGNENTKDVSPTLIQVEGPAKLLNSILFCETGEGVV